MVVRTDRHRIDLPSWPRRTIALAARSLALKSHSHAKPFRSLRENNHSRLTLFGGVDHWRWHWISLPCQEMQTGIVLPSTSVFGGMSTVGLLCLVAAFFFTAGISVVTGGTSLITVPVMLSFGVDPRVAVAY